MDLQRFLGILKFLLLFLALPELCNVTNAKVELKVGIILPSFKVRSFASVFKTVQTEYRRWDRDLQKRFTLKHETIKLESGSRGYSPSDILQSTCDDVVKKNFSAIIYMSNTEKSSSMQYLLSLMTFLGIPVLIWTPEKSGLVQNPADHLVLQLSPSIHHQCSAVLSVCEHYNWKQFSVITTKLSGHSEFIATMRILAQSFKGQEYLILETLKLDELEDPEKTKEQLMTLKQTDTRIILLYASKEETVAIIRLAEEIGLAGDEYLWLVGHHSISKSKNVKAKELPDGIIGITYNNTEQMQKQSIKNGIQIWVKAVKQFVKDHRDISLLPDVSCEQNKTVYWKHGQLLYDYMKNVTIDEDTIAFKPDGTLKDVLLKVKNLNEKKRWKEVGKWTPSGLSVVDINWPGSKTNPPKDKPERFNLKVVTLKEDPYVIYSDPDSNTGQCNPGAYHCRIAKKNITDMYTLEEAHKNSSLYQCCSGLCIDLLAKLSEKMRFTFELFQVEDGRWGAPITDENGNQEWDGLPRALQDGKADMSMTSLKINPERNKVIDFSVPFLETGITILVAVREGAISPTAFLEPFDITSWLLILIACIHLVAVSVFLFEWTSPVGYNRQKLPPREPYDYPAWCLILVFSVHTAGAAIFLFEWLSPAGLNRGDVPLRDHRFSLFRSFWMIWAMLFGAAVNVDNPRGVSSRFMANIWALFAVVFLASYTANLAAFMIAKEDYFDLKGIRDPRLQNPEGQNPQFKFATVKQGATQINLKKNYPEMFSYMEQYNKDQLGDGIQAVKDGATNINNGIHAFIYDATVLEYHAGKDEGCKLKTVGSWYAMTGYGVGFPKGSKYINDVNKYLLEFQHRGDLERLQKYWLTGACKKSKERGVSSHPLRIVNFTSAYILLAGGIVLGGLLLLLEHIYFKFFRPKLRKWDKCGCCGLISLSMGKSLTFEQSVMETIDLQKHYKCKNPICETNRWKTQHELDLALLKIDRLSMKLQHHGIPTDIKGVWKDDRKSQKSIKFNESDPEAGGSSNSKTSTPKVVRRRPSRNYKENVPTPTKTATSETPDVQTTQPAKKGSPYWRPSGGKRSPSGGKRSPSGRQSPRETMSTQTGYPVSDIPPHPPPDYDSVNRENVHKPRTKYYDGKQYSGVPKNVLEIETVL